MARRTHRAAQAALDTLERWRVQTLNGQPLELGVAGISPLPHQYILGLQAAIEWLEDETYPHRILDHAATNGQEERA